MMKTLEYLNSNIEIHKLEYVRSNTFATNNLNSNIEIHKSS